MHIKKYIQFFGILSTVFLTTSCNEEMTKEGIGNAVAEIIDGMPVPDPFFGCLIKASISSIVGQVITCNELRGNYGKGKRYRQILRCLGEHTKGIAFRSIYRAARCMIRFGF